MLPFRVKKAALVPQKVREVLRYLKSVLSLNNSTGVEVLFLNWYLQKPKAPGTS